jgi:ABC-type glutathione transport system ATPase component
MMPQTQIDPSNAILTMKGIGKTFHVRKGLKRLQVRALDNVDLTLRRSKVLGIIGESGSGKSTLANIVMGLDTPDDGIMTFDGAEIDMHSRRARAAIARDIQVVFQDPYSSLNPRMDVFHLLQEPLRHVRFESAAALREHCASLLDMVGLDGTALDRHPHQFSGGQRQRIAIARALALEPKVLVCDEAVSALDVSIQAQVLELLADLRERLGLSIIFIAHGLSAVERICDDVMVMNSGQVVEAGPSSQILQSPADPYTQRLVAVSRDIVPFSLMTDDTLA